MAQPDTIDIDSVRDTMHGKYLMFSVSNDDFGIPVSYVVDILKMQEITSVPGVPENIRGIINMRGEIVTVMDVRMRFGLEPRDYSERTCIIVITLGEHKIGLIVDAVNEVLSIEDEELIAPKGRFAERRGSQYLSYVATKNGKNQLIVDCVAILNQGNILDSESA